MIAILALVAAPALSRIDGNLLRARAAADLGRVRAAADGAVHEAAFRLVERVVSGEIRAGLGADAAFTVEIGGVPVRVVVEDEDGKVDVNAASPALIAAALSAAGVAGGAEALADRIADFRDADGLRRPNGAEDPEYEAAGLPAGAKDSHFDSLSELWQVVGAPPGLADAARHVLTVGSGRAQVDPLANGGTGLGAAIAAGGLVLEVAPSRRRVFGIVAVAELPGGARFTRAAVAHIGESAGAPARWLRWSEGPPPTFPD